MPRKTALRLGGVVHGSVEEGHNARRGTTMLDLSSLLAFACQGGSCVPPSDAHIHVTDTLDASGQFILLHYAFAALQSVSPVLWLGSGADGHVHVSHIARKAVRG